MAGFSLKTNGKSMMVGVISMDALSIVRKYLEDNGFDGLAHVEDECRCLIDELNCCEEKFANCEPGYKIPCPRIKHPDGEHYCYCEGDDDDYHITLKKPEEKNEIN